MKFGHSHRIDTGIYSGQPDPNHRAGL